jgi:hypothetical protein
MGSCWAGVCAAWWCMVCGRSSRARICRKWCAGTVGVAAAQGVDLWFGDRWGRQSGCQMEPTEPRKRRNAKSKRWS